MLIGAHIDEVIRIIRHEDEPKKELMKRFKISDRQADAILEIRLKQLAKVVYIALEREFHDLQERLAVIVGLLENTAAFDNLIIDEITAVYKEHENPRRTIVGGGTHIQAQEMKEAVVDEAITVVLSQQDWVRTAKSHDFDLAQVSYRPQYSLKVSCFSRTAWPLVFLSSKGRVFNVPSTEIPSIRTKGEPLSKWLKYDQKEPITHVFSAPSTTKLICVSTLGYGFLTCMQDAVVKQRAGKSLIKVDQGAAVLCPTILAPDDQWIALLTSQGRLLIIPVADCPELKQGKGNKLIDIRKTDLRDNKDCLVAVLSFKDGQTLRLSTQKRFMLIDAKSQIEYQAARAKRGTLLPRGYRSAQILDIAPQKGQNE